MLRIALAVVTAPFPAALFQSFVVALWPKEGQGVFENPPSMFVAICLYYYIFGLLLGVPAYLIVRRRKPVPLRTHALVGLLVGIVPIGAGLSVASVQGPISAYVVAYDLGFFSLGGAVAGWMFWIISHRRAPTAPDRPQI